ncbi:MAG: dTMP kinase, partial [Shewanella sp.]
IDFFERARATYLKLAQSDDSIVVIDASQSIAEVHKDILAVLQARVW